MKKIKVGILGATGYTGIELIKILVNHPNTELAYLTSTSYAGQDINDVYPHLKPYLSYTLTDYSADDPLIAKLDVVFLALPHGMAVSVAGNFLKKGVKVIDLGADFRFRDLRAYEKAYQEHTAPELNEKAVYGLPEYFRDQIKGSELIANPGCYVTAATLALKPITDNFNFVKGSIIIDAKSGVSGAGRKLTQNTHFPDAHENFSAYKIGEHRHQPEIEQNLGTEVFFSPHLLPVNRGILATCYIKLNTQSSIDELMGFYNKQYANERFVKVVKQLPTLKEVVGSNNCFMSVNYHKDKNLVVVVSVIDNLLKGASGQAVQNMNIVFGFPEETGLNLVPLNP
jgi:N-acetyl-gamma-glutamyl-phosphate reductase